MSRSLNNQNGQLVIEGVLLIVVTLGVMLGAAKFLSSTGFVERLINGPQQSLAGMIESGNWVRVNDGGGNIVETARSRHRNQVEFAASSKGDGG